MTTQIILASGSEVRASLLRNAGVEFSVSPARVDEDMVKDALLAEETPARDIADALAELKALKISEKTPGALVIGSDQILEFDGQLMSKPANRTDAEDQLATLRGHRHRLHSAAVICQDGKPLWRFVGKVDMTMRQFSDTFLQAYLDRNYESVRHCVGCYKLEEEGARLFSRVDGDYFTVLGMPLLELLGYLTLRGELQG